MTEKLEEIYKKVDLLEKRFSNVEFLLKELLNRVNENKNFKQLLTKEEKAVSITSENALSKQQLTNVNASINSGVAQPAEDLLKIGDPVKPLYFNSKTKVTGQVKNRDGKMVGDVAVKVINLENNTVVKETKTSRSGEWMSLLTPGKYVAEYFLENMIDGKVNFNIVSGQTLVRVAQPVLKE